MDWIAATILASGFVFFAICAFLALITGDELIGPDED